MTHANTSTTCIDCLTRRGFLTGLLATGAATVLPSCAVTKPINASPLEAKRDLIDVHHHVWAPAFLKELETRKLAEPPARNWSLNKTLDDMAQAGVTYSITSPTHLPQVLAMQKPCDAWRGSAMNTARNSRVTIPNSLVSLPPCLCSM